jgi:hypothetical protein
MKKIMTIPRALAGIMALLHLITWSKSIPRPGDEDELDKPRVGRSEGYLA